MKRVCLVLLCGVFVGNVAPAGAATAAKAADGKSGATQRPGGAPASFEVRTFASRDGRRLDYSLFVPKPVPAGEKLPLVLCLHGAGGGTEAAKVLGTPELQAKHPCIVVAPGCDPRTSRWVNMPFRPVEQQPLLAPVLELLDSLLRELPVDRQRVYVTGQSMGGVGTWGFVAAEPGRFAAAVPVCGVWQPKDAPGMKAVPIWAFHGEKDPTVPVEGSRRMIAALQAAGATPRYTEYPGVGHNSWSQAYATAELWTWLFAQKRP